MADFDENFAFFKFDLELWRHFLKKMDKPTYHSIALSMMNAMNFVPYRLINYTGHSGAKTGLRHKNRKPVIKTGNPNFWPKECPFGYE